MKTKYKVIIIVSVGIFAIISLRFVYARINAIDTSCEEYLNTLPDDLPKQDSYLVENYKPIIKRTNLSNGWLDADILGLNNVILQGLDTIPNTHFIKVGKYYDVTFIGNPLIRIILNAKEHIIYRLITYI